MMRRLIEIWLLATARPGLQRGASTIEYALATVLVAIVAIVALVAVGGETSDMYTTISDEVAAVGS